MNFRILLSFFSLALLSSFLGVCAQNVSIYTKDGGRFDYAEGEVVSIEFNDVERPDINAPENVHGVDLGLSVKWASCNVGATAPEDTGAYMAWGEMTEKSDYSWTSYFDENCERTLTSICGMADYDVATAKWGDEWRLPTLAEMQELCDKCTWSWTEQNGQKGCIVTGPNGQSIFLPAGGTRQGTGLYLKSSYGSFLTGTRDDSNRFYARSLVFFSTSEHWIDTNLRDYGQSIRPVCK